MTEHTTGTRAAGIGDPLPGDIATIALERAFADLPDTYDDFAKDQTRVDRIGNTSPDGFAAFLDGLAFGEAAHVLDRMQSVADEHRRRANLAESTAQIIRDRFTELGQYRQSDSAHWQAGQPKTASIHADGDALADAVRNAERARR